MVEFTIGNIERFQVVVQIILNNTIMKSYVSRQNLEDGHIWGVIMDVVFKAKAMGILQGDWKFTVDYGRKHYLFRGYRNCGPILKTLDMFNICNAKCSSTLFTEFKIRVSFRMAPHWKLREVCRELYFRAKFLWPPK